MSRKRLRSRKRGEPCAFCGSEIAYHAYIAHGAAGWMHEACKAESLRRALILGGQTYAARQASGWRLKT